MKIDPDFITKFFEKSASLNILVFGDVILDKYISGTTKRISPEAPVPIIHFEKETHRLGGAGNVAINLAKYRVKTFLASIVGGDSRETEKLFHLLKEENIRTDFLLKNNQRQTSVKTRIVSRNQQIVRIDREDLNEVEEDNIHQLMEKIMKSKIKFDAIIFSDYGKGVINPHSFKIFLNYAKKNKIYTALDPKQRNFTFYRNLDLMTPNHLEATEAVEAVEAGRAWTKITNAKMDNEINALGKRIIKEYRLKKLIITRGNQGMSVFEKKSPKMRILSLPTFNRKLYDVSGAGDTVIAICVLSEVIFKDIFLAAFLANVCAGIVVSKFGASYAEPDEIMQEIKLRQKNYEEK